MSRIILIKGADMIDGERSVPPEDMMSEVLANRDTGISPISHPSSEWEARKSAAAASTYNEDMKSIERSLDPQIVALGKRASDANKKISAGEISSSDLPQMLDLIQGFWSRTNNDETLKSFYFGLRSGIELTLKRNGRSVQD